MKKIMCKGSKTLVVLCISVLMCFVSFSFAKDIYEPADGVYHGVWLPINYTVSSSQISGFENRAGKEVAMEIIYLGWYQNCFDDAKRQIDVFDPLGITAHIVWEPFFSPSKYSDVLLDIIQGKQDGVINDMATKCAAYGKPIFLRLAHEMNGNWYPWGGPNCGGGTLNNYGDPSKPDGAEKYIDAFRYVKNRVDTAGATNVIWVWAPNADSVPNESWNQLTNYYPGDDYVDWVGIDFYGLFWGDGDPFFQIEKIYRPYAAKKPIMISETAAADEAHYGGGGWPAYMTKPQWINRLFYVLETYYPKVKAFNWFNEDKSNIGEADWRIESIPYPDSISAYTSGVANPRYLTQLVSSAPQPQSKLHIQSIDMAVKRSGKNYQGVAVVTVVDQNNAPVASAQVTGKWYFNGIEKTTNTYTTNESGKAESYSSKTRKSMGVFTYQVLNIVKDGFVYDAASNLETSDSISY